MNEKTLLPILAGVFLLLLAILLILRKRSGLPDGERIYDDLAHDGRPVKTLYSLQYGLNGKPDLIIRRGKDLIPVEIKSAPGRERPYRSHKLQLAAYCLLVEEHYGIRPPCGILRYRDRQFEIPFSKELETELLSVLEALRSEDPQSELPSRCGNPKKCTHCGFSDICQSLSEAGE